MNAMLQCLPTTLLATIHTVCMPRNAGSEPQKAFILYYFWPALTR